MVESAGILIVLEIAPEMNGWAAAIMLTWAAQAIDRVPFLPPGVAQSNTGRCSSLRCGALSIDRCPYTCSLADSI